MNKNFPFSPNRHRFSLGQGAIIVLLLFILLGNVFYLGYRYYEVVTLSNQSDENGLDKLAIIKKVLKDNYLYSDKVPSEQIFDGAVEGMANAMGDPYTRYVSEKDYQEFKVQTEGTFGGIGVTLGSSDTSNGIVISKTIKGNGADMAGLKPNDRIIEVDGKAIKGMNMEEAVGLIRGEIGSSVTLKVEREGEKKPITVIIQREAVELENVTASLLKEKYGYIRISRFARNTVTQFDEAYKKLEKENVKALIVDLRQNPGGLVTDSSEIASRFIGKDKTLVTVTSKNYSSDLKTGETPYTISIPVVIIVDQQSASASEILTGALKDHKRATVIGDTTFGKGLIQNTFKVDNNSALIVTVSEYVTPNGTKIQSQGIKPDIEVSISPEELLKGIDSQIEKSIEYLDKNVGVKEGK